MKQETLCAQTEIQAQKWHLKITVSVEWYHDKINCLFDPLEGLLKPFYSEQQSRKRKMASRILWSSVHGLCFLEETGKIPVISTHETMSEMADYLIDSFVTGITKL